MLTFQVGLSAEQQERKTRYEVTAGKFKSKMNVKTFISQEFNEQLDMGLKREAINGRAALIWVQHEIAIRAEYAPDWEKYPVLE